jgi:hypothetical protein
VKSLALYRLHDATGDRRQCDLLQIAKCFLLSDNASGAVSTTGISNLGGDGELLRNDDPAFGDTYWLASVVTQFVGLTGTQDLADPSHEAGRYGT